MDEKNNWMMFSVLILVGAFLFSSFGGVSGEIAAAQQRAGYDGPESEERARALDAQLAYRTTGTANPCDVNGDGNNWNSEDVRQVQGKVAKYCGSVGKESLCEEAIYLQKSCPLQYGNPLAGAAIKCPEGSTWVVNEQRCRFGGSVKGYVATTGNEMYQSLTGNAIGRCPEGSTYDSKSSRCRYGYEAGEPTENRGNILTGGVVYDTSDINQNWCERNIECAGDVQPIFNPETGSCGCGFRS